MHAAARLSVAGDKPNARSEHTRITGLHSESPLLLRPTHPARVDEPLRRWAERAGSPLWVALVAGAAGPVGGDCLELTVDVGPGANLVLRAVAATLALPGAHGDPSRSNVYIRVAEGATLVWLPGPVIAAGGCRHHATTRIELEPGARLLAREELILGRHGEQPGTAHQRLRVSIADRPVHDQELSVGPDQPGSDGPAVTGGHRAVGSLLMVDPDHRPAAEADFDMGEGDVAVMPLDGPVTLVTALSPDALGLRRHLEAGCRRLQREVGDTPGLVDA